MRESGRGEGKGAMRTVRIGLGCLLLAVPGVVVAQDGKTFVANAIDARAERYGSLAQSIWDLAEVGYLEEQVDATFPDEELTKVNSLGDLAGLIRSHKG